MKKMSVFLPPAFRPGTNSPHTRCSTHLDADVMRVAIGDSDDVVQLANVVKLTHTMSI